MSDRDRLRVAYVTSSVSRRAGGVFHCLADQTRALAARGDIDVSVFGLADEWTDADRPSWNGVPVSAFATKPPRAFGYAPDMLPALRAAAGEVVHLHGLWMYPSLAVWRLLKQSKPPLLISPHGMLDPWAVRQSAWKKRIVRALFEDANLRGAACLHALNGSEAGSLRAFGLTTPIAIIPNGVALPAHANSKHRGDTERRMMLHLGRLHPKKGLLELVQAWSLLKRDAPDVTKKWRLVLAGWDDGGHEAAVRSAIAERGLDDDIELLGPVYGAAKEALLERASAFVLASHSEGLPMAVLEAWAHGLPVFMTAACNLADGFAEGAAIEITPQPQGLAKTLAARLASDALPGMGERGRTLVRDRYSWSSIAAAYADVYRWLAGRSERPACVTSA